MGGAKGLRFDAVLMECTVNGPEGRRLRPYHHDVETFLQMKKRMEKEGMLRNEAPFVSVHMGDGGQLSHAEAQEYMAPHGVTVGHDDFMLELYDNVCGTLSREPGWCDVPNVSGPPPLTL